MAQPHPIAIQLTRFYRGREPGSRVPVGDDGISFGVADVLVNHQRCADYVYDGDRGTPFGQAPALPTKAEVLPTPMTGTMAGAAQRSKLRK